MKNIFYLFLLVIPIWSWGQKTLDPKLEEKIESLISHTIPVLSCQDLHTKLDTPNLFILDAREKNEYDVSHLPNSIWVGYDSFDIKTVQEIPLHATIVLYCSVGYRSEKIGEKLQTLGYSKVYNLYGGIFEWSNLKMPLVDNFNKSTNQIHPYSEEWEQFLLNN